MEKRLRHVWTRCLLLILAGILAPLPSAALTKTYSVPLSGSPPSGWGCGDALPILYTGTYTTGFNSTLPLGSKVTNVTIIMPMRRAGLFYAQGDSNPVVTASIEGQPIGAANVVAGYFACPYLTDLIPYTFDQPFSGGFSAYQITGTNVVTFNVTGGTCPHWCGVTTQNYPLAQVVVTYDPPPPVDFAITNAAPEADRKVLISNARTSYPYPYFQGIGAQDAAVSTFLRVRDSNGNFASGLTVYMRLLDPPDSAPYMNQAGNVIATNNDNNGVAAIIDGTGVSLYSPGIYQATSGAGGIVNFTLRLQSPTAAGDNYQVEASRDPGFPTGGTAKSGILTAWKRVFIEKRRMLKNGLFLAQSAAAGDTFIITRLNHWGGNQNAGDELSSGEKIVITHAPQLSRVDLNAGWYTETRNILSVQDLGNDRYRVNFGTKQGKTVIPEPLQHAYSVDASNPDIGDGISKIGTLTLGPDHYYDALSDLVTGEAFQEAFTENIFLPDTTTPGAMVPMPFVETADEALLQSLADKWSSVVVNGTLMPNHQLLVIASDNNTQAGTAAGLTISQVVGETSSYVFRHTIEELVSGNEANAAKWAKKTAAHEIAHQWETNGVWNLLDHCPRTSKAYNDPGVYCLLAEFDSSGSGSVGQRTNEKARFHLLPLPGGGWHSEYLGIRRRPDPFVP